MDKIEIKGVKFCESKIPPGKEAAVAEAQARLFEEARNAPPGFLDGVSGKLMTDGSFRFDDPNKPDLPPLRFNKAVVSMLINEGGWFPFRGNIDTVELGNLLPRDRHSDGGFVSPKVDGNFMYVDVYVPKLPGRLSGHRLLMTITIDLTTHRYDIESKDHIPYDRIVLKLTGK